jgi:digeranylgeranylglycerophospholipid reductase
LRAEAVVVGAGPAGLIAARELARMRIEVTVYEEHSIIGEPNHCAGILSVEGLQKLGVRPNTDFIQHEVAGGIAFSPDGTDISIKGKRTRAYVVDRGVFDRNLAEDAMDRGAEIETGQIVSGLLRQGERVTGVRGRTYSTRSDVVIDAEGAAGFLARSVELPRPSEGVLSGINVEVSGVTTELGMVEVWLGRDLAPGLFAWVAPTGEGIARCGLACGESDSHSRLKGFLRERFREYKAGEPRSWPVLTGGPVERTYGDGILLVGDAAGQTKPTTGGGVIVGGLCAIEAARAVKEAYDTGDFSADSLARYEKAWKAELGDEFSSMLAIRRFLNGIPDDRMDRLFASTKRSSLEPVLEELVEKGDMDMQSGVVRAALTNPSLMRVLVSTLGRMAYGELRGLFNL